MSKKNSSNQSSNYESPVLMIGSSIFITKSQKRPNNTWLMHGEVSSYPPIFPIFPIFPMFSIFSIFSIFPIFPIFPNVFLFLLTRLTQASNRKYTRWPDSSFLYLFFDSGKIGVLVKSEKEFSSFPRSYLRTRARLYVNLLLCIKFSFSVYSIFEDKVSCSPSLCVKGLTELQYVSISKFCVLLSCLSGKRHWYYVIASDIKKYLNTDPPPVTLIFLYHFWVESSFPQVLELELVESKEGKHQRRRNPVYDSW